MFFNTLNLPMKICDLDLVYALRVLFMVSFACRFCPNRFVVQVGFCALMRLFEPSLNDLFSVNECILGTV